MRDMRVRSWNASTLREGEAHYYRNVGKLYFEEEPARPDVSSWRAVLIAILFSGQTGNYITSRTRHAPTQTRAIGSSAQRERAEKDPRSTKRKYYLRERKKHVKLHKYYIKPKLTTVKIYFSRDIYVNFN